MNQLRFLSKKKLVEYLDEELRVFLNDKGIYEINQYGWLTDDRPDPEYIGLAMWQTEPPTSVQMDNSTAAPTKERESPDNIFRSGLEFERLMKAARHSIGLTYLYNNYSAPYPDEGINPFQHHYSDAVMKLNLASDRLRELFINSFGPFSDRDTNCVGHEKSRCLIDEHYLFCQPFFSTRDKLAGNPAHYWELLECFGDLVPLVEQTSFYRLESLEQERNLCLSDDSSLVSRPFSAVKRCSSKNRKNSEGSFAPLDIAEWYKLLVKTGSQTFLAEYLARDSREVLEAC